jgi:hypothetical protein
VHLRQGHQPEGRAGEDVLDPLPRTEAQAGPFPKAIIKEPAPMRYAYVNLGNRYAVMRSQDGAAWTALYTVQSEAEAGRFVRVCMRADKVGALSRQRLERGMAVAV